MNLSSLRFATINEDQLTKIARCGLRRAATPALRVCAPLALFLFAIASLFVASFSVYAQEHKVTPPEFNLALVGDAIIVTPVMVHQSDPQFMGVVNAVHKSDAAVINFEGTFASEAAFPVADTGGTWIASDPGRLKDLQGIGLNLFSAANNHSVDFGIRGLLDTISVFKQGGAVFAGIGENLGQARAPGYLSTPHGRVALISGATTFSVEGPAGEARPDMRGRPGLSALRHQTVYRVNAATFDALRKMRQDIGGEQGGAGSPQTLRVPFDSGAVTFELSDRTGVVTVPDPRDLAEITHSIHDAREMANYVVTYVHAHEQIPGNVEIPAQFLTEYAHAAIDAGADVFAASGPHVLRGIEIYKGKVIMYSLGNFIFENDLVVPQPTDLYRTFGLGLDVLPAEMFDARSDHDRKNWPAEPRDWQSVVANVVFRDGRPAEINLTPISLGYGATRPNRGIPRLAEPGMATQILERLQKLSQPFGTTIAIKNGIGTITIEK
jgi:poly-gamma-glutamate capsule biosynthesis protein CapA/YwtB (metallophosphatase superfamily)